ncbi:unnamed protein product, partial [Xylocopa violacea]
MELETESSSLIQRTSRKRKDSIDSTDSEMLHTTVRRKKKNSLISSEDECVPTTEQEENAKPFAIVEILQILQGSDTITAKDTKILRKKALDAYKQFKILLEGNKKLKSKLIEEQSVNKKISLLDSTISNAVSQLNEVKKQMQEQSTHQNLSYADKVKVQSKIISTQTIKPPKNIVTIYPKEGSEINNSETTRKIIVNSIEPTEEKLKIRHMKKINKSGVLIETETTSDAEQILKCKKLTCAGLVAGLPSKRKPKMIIYQVPKDLKEKDLLAAIKDQNADHLNKDKFTEDFKLLFRTGDREKETVNWVIEVTPEIRNTLTKRSKIFIGWHSCSIRDYIQITRCYKCQSFGHISKHCQAKVDTCGHCGQDGHSFGSCSKKQQNPTCVNCKRANKPHDHSSRSKECAAYKHAIEVYLTKVDYGQINGQNSRTVLDEIRHIISKGNIDILCIQEPYSYDNKITGMGNFTVLSDPKRFTNITSQNTIKTAIVLSKNVTVLKLEQLSNTHCICAEITKGKLKFYIINSYFQYSDQIEPYLQHLDIILHKLKGHNIIICLDANAKSPTWHSKHSDERGELLESLIAQHNLFVVNKPSEIHTFDSFQGKTNIDVTLTNSSSYKLISDWTVHQEATISDHNLITFQISTPITKCNPERLPRYNLSRANWKKFDDALEQEKHKLLATNNTQNDARSTATTITKIIQTACESAIPRKTQFPKSVPWWNASLTKLKKDTRTARRRSQTTTHEPHRSQEKKNYSIARNKYIAAIRKAKQDNWKKFVTSEGNRNPWSYIYKLSANKVPIETTHENIKSKGVQALSWEESTNALLEELLPQDDTAAEGHWHLATRRFSEKPPES